MQQINVINNLQHNESSHSNPAAENMKQNYELHEDVAVELDDSEIMLNVPSETMAGQIGVQDSRASRAHKKI